MDKDMEEMRQMMAILKEKLAEQSIVNEQLMRKVIEGKIRRVRRDRWRKALLTLLAMTYVPWVLLRVLERPLWFIAVCEAIFLLAFAWEMYYTQGIDAHDLSTRGLIEVHHRLGRLHRATRRWLWLGIPFILFMLVGMMWPLEDGWGVMMEEWRSMVVSILVGAAVGGVLGIVIYLRNQRRTETLLSDIRDAVEEIEN